MLSCFLIVLILFDYLWMIYSINEKNTTGVVCSFLLYYTFYDFTFINISLSLGGSFSGLLKIVFELIIVYVFVKNMKSIDYKEEKALSLIFISFICSFLVSIFGKDEFSLLMQGFRLYFEYIFVGMVLYWGRLFEKINIEALYNFFGAIVILLFVYGLYQNETISTIDDFWFYDYFSNNSDIVTDDEVNYFRDDKVRVTSIFDGPINSSLYYSYAASFFITFYRKNLNSLLYIIVALLGIYMSHTRIGFVVLLLYFSCFIFIKAKIRYLLLIPLIYIAIIFLSLIFGLYDESSALGRLPQYILLPELFRFSGLGLADEYVIVYFDSFLISSLLAMGVFSIFFYMFFVIFVKRCRQFILQHHLTNDVGNDLLYVKYAYLLTFASLGIIAFQYYTGSASYKIYLLFVFVAFYNLKKEKVISYENNSVSNNI